MLTEINSTVYAVKVNGQIIVNNIPSMQLAESAVFALPPNERAIAEIVALTNTGQTLLLG